MAEYLSDEWRQRVNRSIAADPELLDRCATADLVLQQHVHGAPAGHISYHLILGPDGPSVEAGVASHAHVELRQSYATALAIRSGAMNALEAVQTGAIEIFGDTARLSTHRDVLSRLERAFTDTSHAAKPTRIVLTGFMGTGKSVTGRRLAERLDFDFVDTDHMIEAEHGPIADIFANRGEAEFRRLENAVAHHLGSKDHLVVSTGGGMLLDPDNVDALGSDASIFCLTASVDEILRRVRGGRHRPLLDVDDPRSAIEELVATRSTAYSSFQQIATDGLSVDDVVDVIAARAALAAAQRQDGKNR